MPSNGLISYPISFNKHCTIMLIDNSADGNGMSVDLITKSSAKGHPSNASIIESIMLGF